MKSHGANEHQQVMTNRVLNVQPGFLQSTPSKGWASSFFSTLKSAASSNITSFSSHHVTSKDSTSAASSTANNTTTSSKANGKAKFTMAEVKKHNTRTDCWMVYKNKVYEVTKFLEEHPGGEEVIVVASGKDCTDDFDDVGHSKYAMELLEQYYIGDIDENASSSTTTAAVAAVGVTVGAIGASERPLETKPTSTSLEPTSAAVTLPRKSAVLIDYVEPTRASIPIPDPIKYDLSENFDELTISNTNDPLTKTVTDLCSKAMSNPKDLTKIKELVSVEDVKKAQIAIRAVSSNSSFIEFLLKTISKHLPGATDACWILSGVTSASHKDTEIVANASFEGRNTLQILQDVIKPLPNSTSTTENSDLQNAAIWCLSNIAGDSLDFRNDLLFKLQVLPNLQSLLLRVDCNSNIARQGIWFSANLLNGNPPADMDSCHNLLPIVSHFFRSSKDESVISDSAWALLYLIRGIQDVDVVNAIVKGIDSSQYAGILQKHVRSDKVVEPVVILIGALCFLGFEVHIQTLVDAHVTKALAQIVSTNYSDAKTTTRIHRACIWTLSLIVGGTSDHIQAVIKEPHLLKFIKSLLLLTTTAAKQTEFGLDIITDALWSVRNMSAYAKPEQVVEIAKALSDGIVASVNREIQYLESLGSDTSLDKVIAIGHVISCLILSENLLKTTDALGHGDFQKSMLSVKPTIERLSNNTTIHQDIVVRSQRVLKLLESSAVSSVIKTTLTAKEKFLKSNKNRVKVPLMEKIKLSHNVYLFRFGLPNQETVLGLPIGKHISIWCPNPKGTKEGHWNNIPDPEAESIEIQRKYTPTSSDATDLGYFDLVIKVYRGADGSPFPDGGKMSQFLENLNLGDEIDIAGPFGLTEYLGKGDMIVHKKPKKVKNIGMIAGGTGITPMLQILNAILKDPNDPTCSNLVYSNSTEDDILLRHVLDELSELHPTRLKVCYTLSQKLPEGSTWKHNVGRINLEMLKANLPPPTNPDVLILLCGPKPMLDSAHAMLKELGYSKEQCIDF